MTGSCDRDTQCSITTLHLKQLNFVFCAMNTRGDFAY